MENQGAERIDLRVKIWLNENLYMFKNTLILLVSFFILISPVSATTESSGVMASPKKIIPPIVDHTDPMLLPIFGEDHAYSVTLRGNGEAVVNMRVALSNFEEQPKKNIALSFSGTTPSEVAVYQIVKEKRCVQYDQQILRVYSESRGFVNDEESAKCLKYEEPNYYDYWGTGTKYYKATTQEEGNTIQITLPHPIEPGKSGGYVLFMRIPGYTKKIFGGAYGYRFETLKTAASIRNVNIGISADSDMKFKGAISQVYYQDSYSVSPMLTAMVAKRESFQSSEFDNYVSQIGQGQIYKYSSNMSPGDTYVMEGAYAKSIISLYLKEACILLGSIIFIFLVVMGVVYFLMKKSRKNHPSVTKPVSQTRAMIMSITASFVSGLGVAVYTLLLVGIGKMMESRSYYGFNMIGILLLSVFSFGVYAAIFFGPAIFAGVKRGIWWGVGVFGMTFGWIVLFLLIIGGYYFISQAKEVPSYPDLPVPMMEGEVRLPPPQTDMEIPILAE